MLIKAVLLISQRVFALNHELFCHAYFKFAKTS